MKIYIINNLTDLRKFQGQVSIAIGNFDGVHKGHRHLLHGIDSCITFYPHTKEYFSGKKYKFILTFKEKMLRLQKYGIKNVFIIHFSGEIANMSHIEFCENLFSSLNIKLLKFEESFKFGKNSLGNAEYLSQICEKYKIKYEQISKLKSNNIEISSSLIKDFITSGEIENANRLLGYNFFHEGMVIHGRKIARTIGFPTANIKVKQCKILPKYGVYLVRVVIENSVFFGVCNIGVTPTISSNLSESMQVYIINFTGDIYNKIVKIEFIHYIRNEQKFQSIDALKLQIIKDIEIANGLINEYFQNVGFTI